MVTFSGFWDMIDLRLSHRGRGTRYTLLFKNAQMGMCIPKQPEAKFAKRDSYNYFMCPDAGRPLAIMDGTHITNMNTLDVVFARYVGRLYHITCIHEKEVKGSPSTA